MSTDINLKDCRKAVNQAKYMPTAERKANALKLLKQLTEAVTNLKEVKPKAKAKAKAKPKAKHVTPKRKARKSSNQRLEESQAKDNVCTSYLKPEVVENYKAPRREAYTLSEGETVEMAMAKLRTKRMQDAEALAMAEFEATL